MLGRDLAELYEVETKNLKRQVRRNMERFPEDFMFELSKEEHDQLKNELDPGRWGGTRYAPMAFTDHGVAMLSFGNLKDKQYKEPLGSDLEVFRAILSDPEILSK